MSRRRALASWGILLLGAPLIACVPGARRGDPSLVEPGRAGAAGGAASRPVELSVLTYNIHGLKPRFAKVDPEARLPAIARLLDRYDVALLQEDFAYHHVIRESASHRIHRRGNGQDRNPLVDLLAPLVCGKCGAGLSTLVDLDESALVGDYREPYHAYNGWLEAGHDAWVTKGFLSVRLRLPNGSLVDVYNTHLDAGKKMKREDDYAARCEQLGQLRAAMQERSEGVAVILGGDLNFRADRRGALDAFAASLGLREVEVRADRRWPASDYLFYRGSDDVRIEVRSAGEATEFVDERGRPLSDHPPLFARLVVRGAGS